MRQFKEETRRLSSAKSRVDDAEMAQKTPKLRIREFLRHTLSVREADRLSGKVAQPAHRVKDKRLRRAFGILDTAHWLGFMTINRLLPTPVKQG